VSKTAVIHQPDFLPHLAFFHRLLDAQIYVALDHVQFVSGTSRSWTHRDRIKTPRGAQWLSVGVQKAPLGTPINAIQLSATPWRTRNLNLIRENYRAAAHFEEVYAELERLYALPCARLCDFTLASIDMLMRMFAIEVPRIASSSLEASGTSVELLVALLRKVGATEYVSGPGARAYHRQAPFDAAGIRVVWQDFTHPVYPQLHGEFVPYLSSIDLLFNCGVRRSREILRSR
jgi:hypothetical protein